MQRTACLLLFCLLSSTASIAGTAGAQSYPAKPIRIVVTSFGSGPDLMARLVGQRLTESLGQQVIVENRGSAGGIVGAEATARAVPDGYTIMLAPQAAVTINPAVYKKLPYDPLRDYEPITQITSGAYMMVIHPSLPAKTVKEFIALAKRRPGEINYASSGANNLLAMEQFNFMAGVKTVNIPYKGTGQAVQALLSGEVQVFVISPIVGMNLVKSGKLHLLGMTGLKRSPLLPDAPTVAETLPDFESVVWHGVVAPAKTPQPIINKLAQEIVRISRLPDFKERLSSQGLDVIGSTPEEFATLIRNEVGVFQKLVKQIGYQPQ
jgi:tripartite-type tricarboxylate transporter receptor subunit TctC